MSGWIIKDEADGVPFDPTGSALVSTEVGPALREIDDRISSAVSPGFSWGKSGNATNNTWLLNDTVPSNLAGRVVPVDGTIVKIFAACQNNTTGSIGIYSRSGATFTLLATITFSSQRFKVDTFDVDVDAEDELAARVTSGSFKNPVIGVSITQRVSP